MHPPPPRAKAKKRKSCTEIHNQNHLFGSFLTDTHTHLQVGGTTTNLNKNEEHVLNWPVCYM